jgi:ATP-dependent protease HslVU (ClpYQ) peptidase subunit
MTETAFRVVVTGFCGGTADPAVTAKEIEGALKHYGFEGVTVASMDDTLEAENERLRAALENANDAYEDEILRQNLECDE